MWGFLFLLGVLLCLPLGHCANILGIWHTGMKSHHILGEALLKELARRGHTVTMVSPFPLEYRFPNYTDIPMPEAFNLQRSRESQFLRAIKAEDGPVKESDYLDLTTAQASGALGLPALHSLLETTSFDLVIIDWFMSVPLLVLGSVLDCPVIAVSYPGSDILAASPVACPRPPAYVPVALLEYSSHMSMYERASNALWAFLEASSDDSDYHMRLVAKHFKGRYQYDSIRKNLALILSNGHYSYESPRPSVPALVSVGGFHVLRRRRKLDQGTKEKMDKSDKGLIYVKLGLLSRGTMSKEKMKIFFDAFQKLNYDVFWTWDGAVIRRPRCVTVMPTRSQSAHNEILAHPKMKLFITDGDIVSVIDALYHAVPVLGIPILGAQKYHTRDAVFAGFAQSVPYVELTNVSFEHTLLEMLENPRYKEVAKYRSVLLKDQPMHPMDHAVFWVEHVIRHKGAPHLRTIGADLSFYEYYMIDAVLATVLTCTSVLLIVIILCKCRGKGTRTENRCSYGRLNKPHRE